MGLGAVQRLADLARPSRRGTDGGAPPARGGGQRHRCRGVADLGASGGAARRAYGLVEGVRDLDWAREAPASLGEPETPRRSALPARSSRYARTVTAWHRAAQGAPCGARPDARLAYPFASWGAAPPGADATCPRGPQADVGWRRSSRKMRCRPFTPTARAQPIWFRDRLCSLHRISPPCASSLRTPPADPSGGRPNCVTDLGLSMAVVAARPRASTSAMNSMGLFSRTL